MAQPLDGFLGEVAVQGEVVEAAYGAVQAAVVYYGFRPVEAYVGVAAQLVERKAVDVEPLAGLRVGGEVGQGGLRKALYFK